MKRGDIIRNHWVTNADTQYFIYLGINGEFAKGIRVYKNKIQKVSYYKKDLSKMFDGKPAFTVVGHCDIDKIIANILLPYKEKQT